MVEPEKKTPDSALDGGSLSSPLDLRRRLARIEVRFDWVPLLDACVLALLAGLLHSQFLFSPGLTIDLPESRQEVLEGASASTVLTVRQNMILFEGGRYTLANLESALIHYLEEREVDPKTGPVLLVMADRDVSMQHFLEVCELARAAGFRRIQVAAHVHRSIESGFGIPENPAIRGY